MAINVFKIKKWASLLLVGMIPTIGFAIGSLFYGLWGGLGFWVVLLLLGAVLGNMLLKNPFSAMLEGRGILVFDISSTGIINPFIVKVNSPYIVGKVGNRVVSDVFDREAVYQLAATKKAEKSSYYDEEGRLVIALTEDDYNSARFALFHYPVLIFNSQLGSIVTKDMLANTEKSAFAEHGILYLNRKVEELTAILRDFGRYVVELLKPKTNILGSWWFWLIIGGFVLLLLVLFAPSILQAVGTVGGNAASAVTGGATEAIQPIGGG